MAEMNTIVEGKVKFRDGKKWKPRWCVMKKPSPVADRLLVNLFKDVKESVKGGNPKTSFPLDGFYGLESGICFEKETSVLAIICQKQITLLAFDSRETLIQFEIKIRRSLGEEHQFPVRTVRVPSHSKIPLDLVRMHIHGNRFCLTSQIPPKILCSWQVSDLRRFGTIDGKLCFEGGSRCGKGQGFHVLQVDQSDEIAEIMGRASTGKAPPIIKRQTSKRRSEHIEPLKNVLNDSMFKKFTQNTSLCSEPVYSDDSIWPRPKRHSISFTDYRRAKSYAEKQKLMSIENVEKERLMAIYDIPPRRLRKVESTQDRNDNCSSNTLRMFDVNLDTLRNYNGHSLQGHENYLNWAGEFNNNVMSYQVPVTTTSSLLSSSASSASAAAASSAVSQSDSCSSHGSQQSLQSLNTNPTVMQISSSAPALCGYGNQLYAEKCREYSQSVPSQIAEEIDRLMKEGQKEDVLQSLKQTEQDLQREMSLLDEMLQMCQKNDRKTDDDKYDRPPPLPSKSAAVRSHLDKFPLARGSLDNLSIASDRTYCRPHVNRGGYSSSVLLSPNLLNKLKKIPNRSKMSAPLPYVNLEKYDMGDVDTNHVHIPAASTSAPDGNGHVMAAMHRRTQSRGEERSRESYGANKENKRISVSLPGSRENLRTLSSSDWSISANGQAVNEPIYMNTRCETPPPELPPKGHSLIMKSIQKRAVNSASRPPPPPRPPDRHSSIPKDDKYRHQYQSPRQGVNPVQTMSNYQEEDYFLMGTFEKEPTHVRMSYSESQRLNESLMGRPVVNLPRRGIIQSQSDQSCCYMEMSQFKSEPALEGDSSWDSNSIGSQRPKYVRSYSASGTPTQQVMQKPPPVRPGSVSVSAGNSPRETRRDPPIREENYMLMTTVCPRKPSVDPLQPLPNPVHTHMAGANPVHTHTAGEGEDIYINDLQKRLTFTGDEPHPDVTYHENVTAMESFTDSRENSISTEMPFDNLLDFTLPSDHGKSSKVAHMNTSSDKADMDSSSAKSGGFFSRLIRRNSNSKDRKAISQSHENLLGSNEAPITENMTVLEESSSSGESSRSQSHQDLVFNPKDRSRSSSFPNRASFVAMNNNSNSSSSTGISILSQQSDLGATNSSLNSCGTVSTRASSNECQIDDSLQGDIMFSDRSDSLFTKHAGVNIDQVDPMFDQGEGTFTDSEKTENDESKGNYESQSYFFMGQLESGKERPEALNDDECGKVVPETDSEKCDSNKSLSDNHGGKVFTVLNVQGGNMNSGVCKTDDEKLIELWQSTHSLNFEKSDKESIAELKLRMTLPLEELSPDQKADAIARHISSLPPFVPPKMKSYPVKLSPVLERTTPKKERPEPIDLAGGSGEVQYKPESPVLSPSLMKQQAKATLRITPPSEDEHGKIWIPRSTVKSEEIKDEAITDTKKATLVVDVSDCVDQTDSQSLSSLESSSHGDDYVRSSPASTILRPRSGKEYQKVERRRTTTDGSNTTSPLNTPQSPATGSVFTFETVNTSTNSAMGYYGDVQSPMLSRMMSPEQASICASLRSESIQSPKAFYMNLDFTNQITPPESPCLPLEQLEPQLNYAEIDLSDAGCNEASGQSRKMNYGEMDLSFSERMGSFRQSKKKAIESIPIEYSMIDMVATKAALKARKEHAQSRDGSLRRERRDRMASLSSSNSTSKDRASVKLERKQLPPAYVVAQSTSSVDSNQN